MTAPRVALIHDWLVTHRGGEKCLAALLPSFPDAPIYTFLHRPGATDPAIDRRDLRTSWVNRLPGASGWHRVAALFAPRWFDRLRLPPEFDIVLSFSHFAAKAVRAPAPARHLCYCFSPMRYAWDLRDQYLGPDRARPLDRLRHAWLDRLRDWDRATADRVDAFVAVSRTVARRIERHYQRPARVIPPPVDVDFYTPDDQPRDDAYLVAGALVPYKRVDLAVEACRRLDRPLIVAGAGPERGSLERAAGPRTKFLGRVSDDELRTLFRRCRALLFPGLEDFGIVPVEALACGSPVIALGAGGVLESLPPSSAWFCDEPHVDSLIEAIRRFEAAPDRHDPHLARRAAQAFHPAHFVARMTAAVDELHRHGALAPEVDFATNGIPAVDAA